LLTGVAAEEAHRVGLELVDALADVSTPDPSLTGLTGFSLLHYYADHVAPGRGYAERAEAQLERGIELLAAAGLGPGLFGGFCGTAWVIEHLSPTDAEIADADDDLGTIDDSLCGMLAAGPWRRPYDLISGLVGFAVYALERAHRPRARACLGLIVDQFAALARHEPTGIAWPTPPGTLSPKDPTGYNLGVAHGVPGVIAVLARMGALPDLAGRARPLLEGAVSWLLAQRLPEGHGSAFGYGTGRAVPARKRGATKTTVE
jgi:hypothetical protein